MGPFSKELLAISVLAPLCFAFATRRLDAERVCLGCKVHVVFNDGVEMAGYTTGYSPDRVAFWVTPADPESNNDRVFVVTAATSSGAFVG